MESESDQMQNNHIQCHRLDQGGSAKGVREVGGDDGPAVYLVQFDHNQSHVALLSTDLQLY